MKKSPKTNVPTKGLLSILTWRELQVLELLSHGKEYNEIGHDLGLSVNGVRAHIKNLYRKLGVSNGVQAARFYWEDEFFQRLREQLFPERERSKVVSV